MITLVKVTMIQTSSSGRTGTVLKGLHGVMMKRMRAVKMRVTGKQRAIVREVILLVSNICMYRAMTTAFKIALIHVRGR